MIKLQKARVTKTKAIQLEVRRQLEADRAFKG